MSSANPSPPAQKNLKCPNGHTAWEVHEESFYCPHCERNPVYESDGRFGELWNQRTGLSIAHGTFVDEWGTTPYG